MFIWKILLWFWALLFVQIIEPRSSSWFKIDDLLIATGQKIPEEYVRQVFGTCILHKDTYIFLRREPS